MLPKKTNNKTREEGDTNEREYKKLKASEEDGNTKKIKIMIQIIIQVLVDPSQQSPPQPLIIYND